MSPGPSTHELVDRLRDRRHRVAVLGVLALRPRPARRQRPVADLDGVRAAGDLDDRGGVAVRVAKCCANRSESIVADVMTTLRSGRWGSSRVRYPRMKSMFSDRSCASSMMSVS